MDLKIQKFKNSIITRQKEITMENEQKHSVLSDKDWINDARCRILSLPLKQELSQKCIVCGQCIIDGEYTFGKGVIIHNICCVSLGDVVKHTLPEMYSQKLRSLLEISYNFNTRVMGITVTFDEYIGKLSIFDECGLCRSCGLASRVNVVEACEYCWMGTNAYCFDLCDSVNFN